MRALNKLHTLILLKSLFMCRPLTFFFFFKDLLKKLSLLFSRVPHSLDFAVASLWCHFTRSSASWVGSTRGLVDSGLIFDKGIYRWPIRRYIISSCFLFCDVVTIDNH